MMKTVEAACASSGGIGKLQLPPPGRTRSPGRVGAGQRERICRERMCVPSRILDGGCIFAARWTIRESIKFSAAGGPKAGLIYFHLLLDRIDEAA